MRQALHHKIVMKFYQCSVTTDKARLNVYIPQQLKNRLDQLAEKDRRSLSVTVEILLTAALDALEAQRNKSEDT
jgi:predicted transcriptional regulator